MEDSDIINIVRYYVGRRDVENINSIVQYYKDQISVAQTYANKQKYRDLLDKIYNIINNYK